MVRGTGPLADSHWRKRGRKREQLVRVVFLEWGGCHAWVREAALRPFLREHAGHHRPPDLRPNNPRSPGNIQ